MNFIIIEKQKPVGYMEVQTDASVRAERSRRGKWQLLQWWKDCGFFWECGNGWTL